MIAMLKAMAERATDSNQEKLAQDPSQQPGGDPQLSFGPGAPSMPQYFLGYGLVFALIIGFALAVVGLMRLLR
jgi:hypothetical protein